MPLPPPARSRRSRVTAYVHGVSTRKVDDLVTTLGVDTGISK
jgi:transposase-like protein